jgi:hypothetical protein
LEKRGKFKAFAELIHILNGKRGLHKSVAERLLEIATLSCRSGRTATYFQTPDRLSGALRVRVAYADIAISGNRHTYAVRSRAFRMWLAGEYFNVEGKGLGSQTIQDTLSTLEAIEFPRPQIITAIASEKAGKPAAARWMNCGRMPRFVG